MGRNLSALLIRVRIGGERRWLLFTAQQAENFSGRRDVVEHLFLSGFEGRYIEDSSYPTPFASLNDLEGCFGSQSSMVASASLWSLKTLLEMTRLEFFRIGGVFGAYEREWGKERKISLLQLSTLCDWARYRELAELGSPMGLPGHVVLPWTWFPRIHGCLPGPGYTVQILGLSGEELLRVEMESGLDSFRGSRHGAFWEPCGDLLGESETADWLPEVVRTVDDLLFILDSRRRLIVADPPLEKGSSDGAWMSPRDPRRGFTRASLFLGDRLLLGSHFLADFALKGISLTVVWGRISESPRFRGRGVAHLSAADERGLEGLLDALRADVQAPATSLPDREVSGRIPRTEHRQPRGGEEPRRETGYVAACVDWLERSRLESTDSDDGPGRGSQGASDSSRGTSPEKHRFPSDSRSPDEEPSGNPGGAGVESTRSRDCVLRRCRIR